MFGLAFMWIGFCHFVRPEIFNAIVPRYLGAPHFWTYSSGVLELCLGFGIMRTKYRVHAARALVALVLAMSLANLNMYLNDIPFDGHRMGAIGHFVRFTVQLIILATLLWIGDVMPVSRTCYRHS